MSNLYQFPLEYCLTPYGPMVYMPQDEFVGKSLHEYGWYSPSEVKLLCNIILADLKPSDNFFNIGANIGYLAVAAAKSHCRVYAIEPQRAIYDILCMNAGVNGYPGQISCYNLAFGAEDKTIHIPAFDYSTPNNYGAIGREQWTSGQPIIQAKLDDWLNVKIDVLQLDVEGMELDVLCGARKTLAMYKPTLFLECDRPTEGAELLKALDTEFSYDTYWAVTPLFEDPNPASNSVNVFGTCAAFNIVGLPRSRDLRPGEIWVRDNLRRTAVTDKIGITDRWLVLR